VATIENLICILFFAVDTEIRSSGYGSRILDIIQSLYPENKITLSIDRYNEEPSDAENRLRRKNFYLKNKYIDRESLVNFGKKEQEILIKNGDFHIN